MILVDKKGNQVLEGAELISSDGEKYKLLSAQKPHKPSSSGKLVVLSTDGFESTYYPNVFDLKFTTELDNLLQSDKVIVSVVGR